MIHKYTEYEDLSCFAPQQERSVTAEKEDRRYEWLLSFLSKDVDYGGHDNDHNDDAMIMLMEVIKVMVKRKIKRLQGLLCFMSGFPRGVS